MKCWGRFSFELFLYYILMLCDILLQLEISLSKSYCFVKEEREIYLIINLGWRQPLFYYSVFWHHWCDYIPTYFTAKTYDLNSKNFQNKPRCYIERLKSNIIVTVNSKPLFQSLREAMFLFWLERSTFCLCVCLPLSRLLPHAFNECHEIWNHRT